MTGLRWSSAKSCARKAVYEAEGAPARELYDSERRVMYRGKSLGRDYCLFVATGSGQLVHVASGPSFWVPDELRAPSAEAAGIVAEKPVRWELGTGHADMFVRATGTTVEVLSSAHATAAMVDAKLLQLVGYVEHDAEAQNGMLVVLNPSDFSEERLFVNPDSPLYADLRALMHERIAQVRAGVAGDMPPRVCGKPSEARGWFCRHAATCFEGWEPSALPEVESAEAAALASRVFELKTREREQNASVSDLVKERRAAERELGIVIGEAPVDFRVDPGAYRIGRFAVRRTKVAARESFDLRAARLAGFAVPEECVRLVGAHERWRVELASGEESEDEVAAAIDYGPVPF